ncbi:MAG: hypothetical protein JXL97_00680 [Bacteroidales bacterium]|nr:hypothetical protein [Bacteroidales bacterium]
MFKIQFVTKEKLKSISTMNKLNNHSKLKVFKSGNYEYIYIYYKLGKNILRINTKNKVIKNGMTNDLLYNSRVDDYKKVNEKVIELKKLVDNYIRIKHEEYIPEINQKELEAILKDKTKKYYLSMADKVSTVVDLILPEPEPEIKIKLVNDYYTEFYNLKQKELNNSAGTKHYKSLQNALLDCLNPR